MPQHIAVSLLAYRTGANELLEAPPLALEMEAQPPESLIDATVSRRLTAMLRRQSR